MSRLLDIARAKQAGDRIYRDLNTLFVVSHMRGFTSLLTHLLGAHPQIAGYFETHRNYFGIDDLLRLRRILHDSDGLSGAETWIVDKLLDVDRVVADRVAAREDVFFLFMLRRPQPTLKSLIATGERYGWRVNAESAGRYYFTRLEQIAAQAERAPGGLYLDAEDIVDATEATLERLTRALALDSPLQPEYRIHSKTSEPGLGDQSEYLRQGKIIRQRDDYAGLELAPDLLDRALRAWENCRERLLAVCEPL